ncbi:MAG: hypothetical protein IKB64_10640 [Paludibacteraceae bacterium]|nr:hypothetical protein [Paludibacteraceae bacterium]
MTDREKQANALLQAIAKDIQEKLPDGMGFALLTYEFGDELGRRMFYVSNSDRMDVLRAMAEFIERNTIDPSFYGRDVD